MLKILLTKFQKDTIKARSLKKLPSVDKLIKEIHKIPFKDYLKEHDRKCLNGMK